MRVMHGVSKLHTEKSCVCSSTSSSSFYLPLNRYAFPRMKVISTKCSLFLRFIQNLLSTNRTAMLFSQLTGRTDWMFTIKGVRRFGRNDLRFRWITMSCWCEVSLLLAFVVLCAKAHDELVALLVYEFCSHWVTVACYWSQPDPKPISPPNRSSCEIVLIEVNGVPIK